MGELKLKKFYNVCLVFALFAVTAIVKAQDPHFSQFSYTPLQINPALTGVFDGNGNRSGSLLPRHMRTRRM